MTISSTCLVINGVPSNPRFDAQDDALVSSLQKFWEVESLGIAPPMQKAHIPDCFYQEFHFVITGISKKKTN